MASGERAIQVLSLDGGGVRGLSSLVILQHLVRLVQLRLGPSDDHAEVLPSELFDHIVGTSTGRLIAVMLVKLNMPVSACIKEYKELIPRISVRDGSAAVSEAWVYLDMLTKPFETVYKVSSIDTVSENLEQSGSWRKAI